MPPKSVRGKKTAIITNVVAITDIHTSFVAAAAACLGVDPRSICFIMFSKTTMASSTTSPMATVSEEREIILSELLTISK